MIYKNLYIIGNGFDLHHDIQCHFGDFMAWIKKNDKSLFQNLTKVYENAGKDKWWKDFENSLAQLNVSYYANIRGNLFDPEYLNEGSIDEKTEYASHKVREEFSAIKDSLSVDLQKWLDEAYRTCYKEKKLQLLGKESIFLSFNYTRTLEDIYGIDPDQICHIHGVIDDKDSIIFGHGLGLVELNNISESQKPRIKGEVWNKKHNIKTSLIAITPRHKELAMMSSLKSIYSLKKDVDGCIEKNIRFFDKILNVQRIFVYGFSFSPIDMPYLEEILRRTNPETHWVISWVSQEDKNRILDFFMQNEMQTITLINGIKTISTL